MSPLGWLLILVLAIALDLGLTFWFKRRWRPDDKAPIVRLWGVYSPFFTWIKYRRLPRARPELSRPSSAAAHAPASGSAPARPIPAGSTAGPLYPRQPIEMRQTVDARQPAAIAVPTETVDRFAGAPGLGLGLVLILAGAGQALLLSTPDRPGLGLLAYAAAAVVFVWALRRARVETNPSHLLIGVRPARAVPPRLTLWVTVAALSTLSVLGVLSPEKTPQLGWALLVMWALSVGLYSLSVVRLTGWVAGLDVRAWWRAHWRLVLVAAAFGAAAFSVRVYDLELHPYAFINDEGEVGKEAQLILAGKHSNFFEVGWASEPIFAFVPAAISVKLLGHTALAVRLVSAVQGALTVSLLYLLGREIFDSAIGGLAAAVLLALPLHLHFSRLGVNNVGDAFFSTLTIWLIFRAIKRGTPTAYLIAGLATGSALYTYLGSRLAIALVFGTLVYALLRCRGLARQHAQSLLIFAGAVVVVALPIAAYFIKTPDQFYARLNSEGILNNGDLQRRAAAGPGYLGVLWDQFSRSTLVYVARPAFSSFFNSPLPYLTPLAAIFFVLGLAYAIWRLGDPRYMTLFAWFWAVVVLGSTLTIGPPSSQRLLMSAPPLALLVALGLRKSASLLPPSRLIPAGAGLALCGLVVVITGLQGIGFYFGSYRWRHYFEDPSNEFSYEVALKIESLGPTYRAFLLGDPSVYSIFGDFGYLASDVEVLDYNTVTPATLAGWPHDKGAIFVAVPSRVEDLRLVQKWLPGGTWQMVPRRYQAPELSYFDYIVPPQVVARP